MKKLRALIGPYVDVVAGGEDDRSLSRLTDRLEDLRRRNEKYFIVPVVMIVLLFLTSLGLVVWCREQPGVITAVFGALGCTVFGGVGFMRKLWREKVALDLVLAVMADLPEKEARAVLKVFVARL